MASHASGVSGFRATDVLINALSVSYGGSVTVGQELTSALARVRPDWDFTLVVKGGDQVFPTIDEHTLPSNVQVMRAPAATANRAWRVAYENMVLSRWVQQSGVRAVLQLNGMIVPAMRVPTLTQHQNPWPYRPDVMETMSERFVAALQRREHARAFREASFIGWTSGYLRDLVCGYFGLDPREKSDVFYNGVTQIEPAETLPWSSRPMEILTVSTVQPHKRQDLVIRAVAALSRRRGFEDLRYRIAGYSERNMLQRLQRVAAEEGVSDRIIFEGHVSQERLAELYGRARVFAFMSVCECFGLPPLEAMAYGTPTVASDSSSAREIYGDAVEYCPPDELDLLVESLAHVLTNEERATELARLGRVRRNLYQWDVTATRMSARLESLMAKRPT